MNITQAIPHRIGGRTRAFAVLGHPVSHTLSPVMHNAAFAAWGFDAVYLAFDVEPARVIEALRGMAALGFGGVNLTVPLKETAFDGLPRLDASARVPRAVNTVAFDAEGMTGHNTDGYGFLRDFREVFGTGLQGASVCILGTGGSARGVGLACACEGVSHIVAIGRRAESAQALTAEMAPLAGSARATWSTFDRPDWMEQCRAADVVIHTTTVGMRRDDPTLAPADAFRAGQLAYDLIYVFRRTAFMRAAEAGGARAANGLGMLLHQGARALEIWTGREAPLDVMRRALEERVYGAPAN